MHIAKCQQVFGETVTFHVPTMKIPHIFINTRIDIILALGIIYHVYLVTLWFLFALFFYKNYWAVVAYAFNSGPWEAEAGNLWTWGQPGLQSGFQGSWGFVEKLYGTLL